MISRWPLLLAATNLLAACDRPPEPPPPAKEAKEATSATPTPPSARRAEGPLAWEAPAPFEKVESPSPMRKATYRHPPADGDTDAPELAVTQVGGSVDANVDRWVGQFGPDARKTLVRTTQKVGDLEVIIVELSGTFDAGGMMGAPGSPKEGWALLAAIVPAGEQSWFFKMTGPSASVKAARPAFDGLVASLRPG